jgi:hypothetical protein
MKKSTVLSGLPLLLLFTLIVASCSKKQTETRPSQPNTAELLNNLSSFNKSKINSRGATLRACSGFWSCLGQAAKVAGADIAGVASGVVAVKEIAGAFGLATGGTGAAVVMITGGAIAGAGASYAAAFTAVADTPTVHKYGNLTINAQQFTYLSPIGVDHNTVIHDNFYYGAPLQEFYNVKGLSDIEKKVVESPAMSTVKAKLRTAGEEYTSTNFDFGKLTQRLQNDGLINPEIKNVLDLFMEVYTTSENEEQMTATINYYISEVANSGLHDDDKEALVAAFVVASQSPFYFLDNF